MYWLAWIEQSPLGLWVRESVWGFPISLTLHAFGMAFLVGGNIVLALRALGYASGIPLVSLPGLLPLIRSAAWLALVSGLLLLTAYPAKSLTNPLFYFKLSCISVALFLMRDLGKVLLTPYPDVAWLRRRGIILLVLWAASITAGRFLAYTYSVLTIADRYF